MSDRICRKCAIKLGAKMREGTVHTMSLEKCARCKETAIVCRAVNWGVVHESKELVTK
jgi:hypothetical protein